MDSATQTGKPNGRAQRIVPILLVVCVVVVAFWEIMAARHRRPFMPFQITGEEFRAFAPVSPLWSVRPLRLPASPTEPNIVAFELEARRAAATAPILVRLVHGYNMCDCMRIKGYKVEPVEEGMAHGAERRAHGAERRAHGAEGMAHGAEGMAQRSEETPGNPATDAEKVDAAVPGRFQRPGGVGTASAAPPGNPTTQQPDNSATGAEGARRQVWRLTSSSGQVSIWVTAMIRAGDFSETEADVRSMAFPRIGIPDDPNWIPRGLTWRSLRHPASNFRQFLRAKWNNSRCDLATFLGLRQPAWASDELLTLVAAWGGPSVERADEPRVTEQVLAAGDFLYGELKKWRGGREER